MRTPSSFLYVVILIVTISPMWLSPAANASCVEPVDEEASTAQDNGSTPAPVSSLCATEEFAQRWKFMDYRQSVDAESLVALGKVSPSDIPLIVRQLKDPSWQHRQAAAQALGEIGDRDPDVLVELRAIVDRGLPLLRDIKPESEILKGLGNYVDSSEAARTDIFVVKEACIALARLGDKDPLLELLAIDNSVTFDASLDAMQRLGFVDATFAEKMVSNFQNGVWNVEDRLGAGVVEILGLLGRESPEVIRFLEQHFSKSESIGLRIQCGYALWQIGNHRPDVAESLVQYMRKGDLHASSLATAYLARYEPPHKEVLPKTLQFLKRGDPDARRRALLSLSSLVDNDKSCVTALEDALLDPTFDIRRQAAFIMLEAGLWSDHCIELLAQLPDEQENSKAQPYELAELIVQQGKGNRSITDILLEWCKIELPETAGGMFGSMMGPDGTKYLAKSGESDILLPVAGLRLLRLTNCREEQVIETVAGLTKSQNEDVRNAAIGTLFTLAPNDPRAIEAAKRRERPMEEEAEASQPDEATISSDPREDLWKASAIFRECGELTEIPRGFSDYMSWYLDHAGESLDTAAIELCLRLHFFEDRAQDVVKSGEFKDSGSDISRELADILKARSVLDDFAITVLFERLNHPYATAYLFETFGTMAQQVPEWTDETLLKMLESADERTQMLIGITLSWRLKSRDEGLKHETRDRLQTLVDSKDSAKSLAARRVLWFIERRRAALLEEAEIERFHKNVGMVEFPAKQPWPK